MSKNTGPTRDSLGGIMRMMRGFMVQKSQGYFNNPKLKGKAVPGPDHICKVCGGAWGKAPPDSELITDEVCVMCKQHIDDGEIALVCGNRYVFAKSESLKGTTPDGVIHVNQQTMEALGHKFLHDNAENDNNPS